MTCTNCSATLVGSARFCASCGTPTKAPGATGKGGASDKGGASGKGAVRGRSSIPNPPIVQVDPLGATAPDAFAETANAEAREQLQRALADYDAKQKAASSEEVTRKSVGQGQGLSPPTPATVEMRSIPSPVANPQVSPKAKSHFTPVQGADGVKPGPARTAAMPLSAPRMPSGQPPARPDPRSDSKSDPRSDPRFAPIPDVTPLPRSAPNLGGPRMSPAPPAPIAPGSTVSVLWANGLRYRATVAQITGSRVLVVFPDGRQHWIEMAYVSGV